MTVKLKSKRGNIAVYEFVTTFKEQDADIKFTTQRFKDDFISNEIPIEFISEYTLYQNNGEEIETKIFPEPTTN